MKYDKQLTHLQEIASNDWMLKCPATKSKKKNENGTKKKELNKSESSIKFSSKTVHKITTRIKKKTKRGWDQKKKSFLKRRGFMSEKQEIFYNGKEKEDCFNGVFVPTVTV